MSRKKIFILFLIFVIIFPALPYTATGQDGNDNSEGKISTPHQSSLQSFLKTGNVKGLVEKSGILFAVLILFLSGFLLSFTPCIYPMIPITLGIIGARSQGKPFKGFVLSLFFVFGISITFSILGLSASFFGVVFGALLQNKIVLSGMALLFFILALSMLGAFEIQLPAGISSKIQHSGERGGYIGAFLMGLAAGIIASPCSSPVLVGMIAYVAQLKNPILGFLYFFSFAWGLGVLFIILGTFPALITSLPRAGEWMIEIRHLFGVLLLIAGFYFLRIAFYKIMYLFYFILSITSITLGVFAGAFYPIDKSTSAIKKIKKSLGILLLLVGIFSMLKSFYPGSADKEKGEAAEIQGSVQANQSSQKIQWLKDINKAKELAKKDAKPMMIDFYADWCLPCKEMDKKTFKNPEVIKESERFVCLKIDNTESNPEGEKLLKKYDLQISFPAVIFLNSKGEFEREATINKFTGPEEFLMIIKRIK